MIDEMAAAGIVGEYKGSQAREVILSADQWEQMKQEHAARLQEEAIRQSKAALDDDGVEDMMFDDDI